MQQHNQSVVGNYVRFLYQVSCAFQRCINFKNLLRFDKVRESLKVGTFLRQSVQLSHMKHFCVETEVRLAPNPAIPRNRTANIFVLILFLHRGFHFLTYRPNTVITTHIQIATRCNSNSCKLKIGSRDQTKLSCFVSKLCSHHRHGQDKTVLSCLIRVGVVNKL